jgi:protein transport protein SEC31
MDDNSKRLGALLWRLNEGGVSPHVAAKLLQLCAALDAGNYAGAAQIQARGAPGGRAGPAKRVCAASGGAWRTAAAPWAHMSPYTTLPSPPRQVELTTSDWDECGTWLTALKRLIKVRQMAG